MITFFETSRWLAGAALDGVVWLLARLIPILMGLAGFVAGYLLLRPTGLFQPFGGAHQEYMHGLVPLFRMMGAWAVVMASLILALIAWVIAESV